MFQGFEILGLKGLKVQDRPSILDIVPFYGVEIRVWGAGCKVSGVGRRV